MAHESRNDEDNASLIDQTREEQCPEWIDDTDDSSAISRHSCSLATVPTQNARKRESHAVIKCQATTSEISDEDEQTYIMSKILTQNAQGLGTYVRTRLLTTRDMNIS